ncbi:MAG TPA: DUF86 domain-containing protein [Bacteroidia bacterium]|jgi:uncharacterized protein with HEPN domain|nr:DUF86 domain-containing protein [Bacteroidia bacterium]
MSKRIPSVIIEDILESIGKIMSYTVGMDYDSFLKDSKTREAVYRNFEVMGEAANRMPNEFIDKYSEIEWHKIISTRNIIIHSYDEIDDSIIWNIIQNSLPELQSKLEDLLKRL